MRVGIVYTSTTPELIETVNTELKTAGRRRRIFKL